MIRDGAKPRFWLPAMNNRAFRMTPAVSLRFAAASLLLAAAVPTARAELVVLENGRVLKVESHQYVGERIEIRFSGGGSLTFDRSLVEGIEADEVARADVQAPPLPPPPSVAREEEPRPPAPPRLERVSTSSKPQVTFEEPKVSEGTRNVRVPQRNRHVRR